jgi:tetratricopeptide (TPR) repeat protein
MEPESEFETKFFEPAAGDAGAQLGADIDDGGAGGAADVGRNATATAPAAAPTDDPFGYGGDGLGGLDDAATAVRARRLERYHETLLESNVELPAAADSHSSAIAARTTTAAGDVSSALTAEGSGVVPEGAVRAVSDSSVCGGEVARALPEAAALLAAAAARKDEGNRAFSAGDMAAAAAAYTEALDLAPRHAGDVRAVYFCNRAAARLALDENEPALWDCDRALELTPAYFKALARRARVLERLGLLDEALRDARAAAACEGSGATSAREVERLSTLVTERDEKLKVRRASCALGPSLARAPYPSNSSLLSQSVSPGKQTEMFGKLKDLGNSVLGWFGMSVDNFKAVKDPQTGSYSLSFQQNNEK